MSRPVFEFRYPHFGNLWQYGTAMVVLIGIWTYQAVRDGGDPLYEFLLISSLTLIFVGLFAALHLFPHAVFGKRVAVSSEGVRMWRTVLPAERIAEVVEVDAETAGSWVGKLAFSMPKWSGKWRVEDREVARLRSFYPWWKNLPGVMVRDRDGGARPWWLLAVPDGVDPTEFAEAIRSIAPSLEESERGD